MKLIAETGVILPSAKDFKEIDKAVLKSLDAFIRQINTKYKHIDIREKMLNDDRTKLQGEERKGKKVVGYLLYDMRRDFLFAKGKKKKRLR